MRERAEGGGEGENVKGRDKLRERTVETEKSYFLANSNFITVAAKYPPLRHLIGFMLVNQLLCRNAI